MTKTSKTTASKKTAPATKKLTAQERLDATMKTFKGDRTRVAEAFGAHGDREALVLLQALPPVETKSTAKKAPASKPKLAAVETKAAAKPAPDSKELAKVSYRVLTAAAFTDAARTELATQLGVQLKPKMSRREIARDIAKAIGASGKLPPVVAAAVKPKKERAVQAGPRRIEVIVSCLRRKTGATVQEIGAALLEAFPKYSTRFGGGQAEQEVYERFARTAISHLRAHRQFSEAKAMAEAGETVVLDKESHRYRIVKSK